MSDTIPLSLRGWVWILVGVICVLHPHLVLSEDLSAVRQSVLVRV